jgi:hypothetical protein
MNMKQNRSFCIKLRNIYPWLWLRANIKQRQKEKKKKARRKLIDPLSDAVPREAVSSVAPVHGVKRNPESTKNEVVTKTHG